MAIARLACRLDILSIGLSCRRMIAVDFAVEHARSGFWLVSTEQRDFFGGGGKKLGAGYRGYPGTGPDGETCGSCAHLRVQSATSRRYYKCGIGNITRGPGTDIRLKTLACEFWKGNDDE
jgi:hypothetical protein